MLEGYRILDPHRRRILLGGQIFGDLGADVIKIEPPEGSPTRNNGTFYKDIPGWREKPLLVCLQPEQKRYYSGY